MLVSHHLYRFDSRPQYLKNLTVSVKAAIRVSEAVDWIVVASFRTENMCVKWKTIGARSKPPNLELRYGQSLCECVY